ncbi:MAG: creatininase family protein [Ruminococcaceae bacterium]|nr:creatininase family protein [Oscillospiraceae bacterium]
MLDFNVTADEIVEKAGELAILPIGSTEQHGPHLPMCTDYVVATEISKRIAEKTGAYLLPTLPISTCYEHKGKKGSVWMKPDTFYSVIQDIVLCLKGQGFKKVAVVLGHGGIFIATPAIRELNAMFDDLKVAKIDFLNFFGTKDMLEILESPNNLHACEYETSLMLYFKEELVKKDKIKDADCVPQYPRDFLNYVSLIKLSKNGVWGEPSLGTKEKGEKIARVLVDESIKYMNRVFDTMEYDAW